MKTFKLLLIPLTLFLTNACSQSFGPGYQFSLFKNTPNWELARAVEQEDTSETTRLIKTGKYNIDLQEPKFGRTLLLLAVGNDKYASTYSLLENGASVNIRDSFQVNPINEATSFIHLKKNTVKILKTLVKYGANVNDPWIQIKNSDTVYYSVPLCGAISDLECTKFLLDNNANLYVQHKNIFLVWDRMFLLNFDESIFVAKYLIIDKKTLIPDPLGYGRMNKKPVDIFILLNHENFRADSTKEKAKQEIIDYLHKIDFPKNQVFNK